MNMKRSEMDKARAENARAWGPIDGLDGPDADRQAELAEQGAGNAVADLKAGFGEAAVPVPVPPGTAEVRVEDVKVVQPGVPPVPGWSAREVGENILAAQASLGACQAAEYVPEGVGVASSDEGIVDTSGWAAYWEARCLRAENVNPQSPSEVEQERDYWMGRARTAEHRLRVISAEFGRLETLLKGLAGQVGLSEGGQSDE